MTGVRPLMAGRVTVDGCDVTFIALSPEEFLQRVWKGSEFDTAKVGVGAYMNALGRGISACIAIPGRSPRCGRHAT